MNLKYRYISSIALILPLIYCCSDSTKYSLKDKRICIDPGHGGTTKTDSFRVGFAGEREEMRVAEFYVDTDQESK